MVDINEAIEMTRKMYEALRLEYQAHQSHAKLCTDETHQALADARKAAIELIKKDMAAIAIYNFGHRLGMEWAMRGHVAPQGVN